MTVNFFNHPNQTIPHVYIKQWGNTIHLDKFKQIIILPFEYGYYCFDKPILVRQPITLSKAYYGEFNRLPFDKNKNTYNFNTTSLVKPQPRLSKQEYLNTVNSIKKHIKLGDIYEINFCFDFYIENITINPYLLFERLFELSEAPFSALIKLDETYLIISSPERYLQKIGNTLLSQPMKGTRKLTNDAEVNNAIIQELKNNFKEQNENVMIVDLVRNDLSRIAEKNSVKVNELFGVYAFNTVAQMISTISCSLKKNTTLHDILYYTFPMGSMTGAPKPKSLELINQYEHTPRGYYSGTIGFEDDKGNFDLCVVIRSVVYNERLKHLTFHVGSAITNLCNPEEEYNECLIKAENMIKAIYDK